MKGTPQFEEPQIVPLESEETEWTLWSVWGKDDPF